METKVTSIRAYNKHCIGCEKHQADVMIGYTVDDATEETIDLFLTTEMACELFNDLDNAIKRNELF